MDHFFMMNGLIRIKQTTIYKVSSGCFIFIPTQEIELYSGPDWK